MRCMCLQACVCIGVLCVVSISVLALVTTWRCSDRSSRCGAIVKEVDSTFEGVGVHTHPPKLGGAAGAKLLMAVKEKATQHLDL